MTSAVRSTQTRARTHPLELAAAVSDRVDLKDVRLMSSTTRQTPRALDGPLVATFSHRVEVQAIRQQGAIIVYPQFTMTGTTKEGDHEAVFVEATFQLLYQASALDGLKKSNFTRFAEANGIYNAWPYWREFVQSTVARMGLPQLVVPVFRLVGPPAQPEPPKKAVAGRPAGDAPKRGKATKRPSKARLPT